MKNIEEIQNEIIEEFSEIDNWKDRYSSLIEYGRDLENYPNEYRTDSNLIKECQNRAWVHCKYSENKDSNSVKIYADSEAAIVKGLMALVIEVYSGASTQQILNTPPEFISKLKFAENLTRNRVNGLASVITRIQQYALGFELKKNNANVPCDGLNIHNIHKPKINKQNSSKTESKLQPAKNCFSKGQAKKDGSNESLKVLNNTGYKKNI